MKDTREVHKLTMAGRGLNFSVSNDNVENALRGVMERVFFAKDKVNGGFKLPPVPEEDHVRLTLAKFRALLLRRMGENPVYTTDEFLSCYTGRKLKIYTAATESLLREGIVRKDSFMNSFLKAEKLNLSAKPDPCPRLIQPRSPRFNAAVGMYIKPVEHKIYAAINNIFGDTVVAKGLNASRRGEILWEKWRKFKDPVALGLDASRFDQHVHIDTLKWEHSVYSACFKRADRAKLKKMLAWQRDNIGFVNFKGGSRIKYRTKGKRMSGDMNTALGNVLIMCAMMWTYAYSIGITIGFMNDGDDCVVIVEKTDRVRFEKGVEEYFTKLGFTMIVEGCYEKFEHIVFCQSQPVLTQDGYRMVRDPRIITTKDLICTTPFHNVDEWNSARAAIAGCGLALAGDVPVCGAFYSMMTRGTDVLRNVEKKSGMDFLADGMNYRRTAPTDECRVSFFVAFGLTPDEQIAIEEHYDAITPVYCKPALDDNRFSETIDYLLL